MTQVFAECFWNDIGSNPVGPSLRIDIAGVCPLYPESPFGAWVSQPGVWL